MNVIPYKMYHIPNIISINKQHRKNISNVHISLFFNRNPECSYYLSS